MSFNTARSLLLLAIVVTSARIGFADGPADNTAEKVRRVPKLGVEVSEADRKELVEGLEALQKKIDFLKLNSAPQIHMLLPDVMIFHRAVQQALDYQEFFEPKEIPVAKTLLKQGLERAEQLTEFKSPWLEKPGPTVRGYISRIDNTVQPYGIIIPEGYKFDHKQKTRLDFWFHGRGETLSEVNFLNDRLRNRGPITPPDTIVLHPYGRYCNANKLAGEVDLFEALQSVKETFYIDSDRISVRGFSMGGAACWQFAVHYPDMWFAANPGAGFSETPDFLKVFQKEELKPTWYEEKLWRMYDCPGYAANLAHLPTIAYSGDMDSQKQAADLMAAAFEREGMKLLHIIGPNTGHSIHPESAKIIEAQMADWAVKGVDHLPPKVQLVTFTLKYNRMHWLTIDGMKEHWEEARITTDAAKDELVVKTKNVSAFTIRMGRKIRIDDSPAIDAPIGGSFVNEGGTWKTGKRSGLQKKHGLQGPIDDAFMDRFIFVTPSGKCRSEAVDKWVQSELDHAITHWRRQMRGDAIVKQDRDITDQDIAQANLVLWGDSQANSVYARIADKLPIQWTANGLTAGDRTFDGAHSGLIAIWPNPLNPEKYVVLNSGFTYREYDYLNNARQVPKLPDWAIVDVRVPPNSRFPGKIVDADFFDEQWKLKPARK